jgi:hypothetical protein
MPDDGGGPLFHDRSVLRNPGIFTPITAATGNTTIDTTTIAVRTFIRFASAIVAPDGFARFSSRTVSSSNRGAG